MDYTRKQSFLALPLTLGSLAAAILLSVQTVARAYTEENSPLRLAADKAGFLLGTAVEDDLVGRDTQYEEVVGREYNIVTTENAFKFRWTEPEKGKFSFKRAEKVVSLAEKNGQKVRGHTLIWHLSLPSWLSEGNFTKEEISSIFNDHIDNVVGGFKGRIYAWDVVNEVVDDDGKLRNSIWRKNLGDEYIARAFERARAADPDAKLFLNENSIETWNDKAKATYDLIKSLKAKGVPIDGIGFQTHVDKSFESKVSEFKEVMQRFASLGLEINITEMDVDVGDNPKEADFLTQARIYSKVLDSCLSINTCKALVVWGANDKNSWLRDDSGRKAYPLLLNDDYNPKPAYNDIIRRLQK